MNKKLNESLYRFKFETALNYIDDSIDDRSLVLISDLADTFGDVGWITGTLFSIIVNSLENIGVEFPEGEDIK